MATTYCPETTTYRDTTDHDAESLIAACVAGDQDAWRTMVERLSPIVWTVARSHRLSPDDCQDVYQLTWMRAVQHLHKIRSPDRLSAWFTTAARRECLKHIERNRKHVPVGDSAMLETTGAEVESPDATAVRRARDGEILAVLRKLPARDQDILGLLMTDPPASYDEVSRILGVPRGSIGPLRQRALARMRGMLA
jgi:RNA polymerase sigma factor (sigma-70 family)